MTKRIDLIYDHKTDHWVKVEDVIEKSKEQRWKDIAKWAEEFMKSYEKKHGIR